MKTTNYQPEIKKGFIEVLENESTILLEEALIKFKNGGYGTDQSERWYNADVRSIKESLQENKKAIIEGYGVDGYNVRTIKKYLKLFGGKASQTRYSSDGGDFYSEEITLGNNKNLRKSATRSTNNRNY